MGRICDLLLTSPVWQRWWDVGDHVYTWLHKHVALVLLASLSLSLSLWVCVCVCVCVFPPPTLKNHTADWVHDKLLQNMASWLLNSSRWRSLKTQQKQESHSDVPTYASPLKQVRKSSCERCPPYTQRTGASLSTNTKGHWEEPEQTGLAKFPPVSYTYLILSDLSYFSTTVHSSSNLA